MNAEYRIHERNLPGLRASIAVLNKRAAKLGLQPITITEKSILDVPHKDAFTQVVTRVDRYVFVEVSGETPKLADWSLAAVVEHTEEGNILRKSPDFTGDLSQYRTGNPCCDHCNTVRVRRQTYVVSNAASGTKMIGSTCLTDFLGGKNPHSLAKMAEIMFSLREICEGAEEDGSNIGIGGGLSSRVAVAGVLAFAAAVIRRYGFVSRKKAGESQEVGSAVESTALRINFSMDPPPKYKDAVKPEQCDVDFSIKCREYVLETLGARPAAELNDFEHTLLTVCRCESVEAKNMGMLAFVPEYYARNIEREEARKREAAEAVHYGIVGKRVKGIKLTYVKSTSWESQYGIAYLHKFTAEAGEPLFWKTGTDIGLASGEVVTATFTVKEHGEYKGIKQTKVSRMVLAAA